MPLNLQASPQWERILQNWVTEDAAADLSNFKADKRNYSLSLWNPEVCGIRYLKTLVYHLATELTPEDWVKLRNIRNREVGDPLTVRIDGEPICIDYLQAVMELGFIEKHVDLQGAQVAEIGAGYGRTCHAVLSNYELSQYWIIDLTNTLRLSMKYLGEVLDDAQYSKVRFVDVADISQVMRATDFGLFININSFAEMTLQTVRDYLDLIDTKCAALYVKNAVGKFMDKKLDGHHKGSEAVQLALQSGPLKNVLDIFDNQAVAAAASDYIAAYMPGESWRCVADGLGYPWSYYWQALYMKSAS
jgi:putative sugar O-methyltransferase